jgi:hypothetical protein
LDRNEYYEQGSLDQYIPSFGYQSSSSPQESLELVNLISKQKVNTLENSGMNIREQDY